VPILALSFPPARVASGTSAVGSDVLELLGAESGFSVGLAHVSIQRSPSNHIYAGAHAPWPLSPREIEYNQYYISLKNLS